MKEHTRGTGGAATVREAVDRISEQDDEPLDPEEDLGPDPDDQQDAREVPQVRPAELDARVDASTVPAWVKIPADLQFPPEGVTWVAMKFEPEWTDRPHLGERQCIIWNLSVG